ncbi:iron chelate uptake ABC transporter family permease subunit [Agromyces sp. Marseille-P2726]|uniref:FecCD family ABC transporter permease n=1 Tax=Agromyces sp. Marseille-P2726 TaxID=2709132 RepID=UPI00156F196D|nr:iron chelate uptake ABC transporter family permease subunit [Agromyces sp. Marseille-P2726]
MARGTTFDGRLAEVATRVAVGRARRRRREASVLLVTALVALVAATASLLLGAAGLTPGDVLAALVGQGSPKAEFVIVRLRLPRVLAAVIAGSALGLGGALFQTTLRNPLASPDILGVTGGASLAAVGSMLLLGLEGPAVSLAAFAGALGVAALMWGLAWRGGLTGIRFVLVGIGLASIVGGLLGWLITRADVREASEALVWMVGGIASIAWPELATAGGAVAVLLVLTALFSPRMPLLALSDDSARSLGVGTTGARAVAITLGVALVAAATALAGPIAFVALVAAPIARALVGHGQAALAASAVIGSTIVLVADLVAQHAFVGTAVPVGIVTGLIGAPYLLWLIARGNRKGSDG